MITLGCIVPQPNDATSWYRAYGPLKHCREGVEIVQLDAERMSWSDMYRCDAIFLQRPAVASDVYLPILEMAERVNCPIWVDFDDLLTDVPVWNPLHARYASKESIKVVRESIMAAKVVTVSTQALANNFLAEFPSANIKVIPNALDSNIKMDFSSARVHEKIKVLWRGGGSHGFDLQIAAEFFMHVQDDTELTFLGHIPEFAYFGKQNWRILSEHMQPPKFLQTMGQLTPHLVVVPLVDCEFNKCKSNIAYLEATAAGALVLAPDWPEWQMPGCFHYRSAETFREDAEFVLDAIRNQRQDCIDRVAHAKEFVRRCRLSDGMVAEKRKKIIKDLVNG